MTEERLAFEVMMLQSCDRIITDKPTKFIEVSPFSLKAYIEETQRQRKEARDQVEGLETDAENMLYTL